MDRGLGQPGLAKVGDRGAGSPLTAVGAGTRPARLGAWKLNAPAATATAFSWGSWEISGVRGCLGHALSGKSLQRRRQGLPLPAGTMGFCPGHWLRGGGRPPGSEPVLSARSPSGGHAGSGHLLRGGPRGEVVSNLLAFWLVESPGGWVVACWSPLGYEEPMRNEVHF